MKIKVDHLTKVYQTEYALNDINCSFESQQIHGIVGRNGSGKSVLLRCLCGYTKPTSGTITIDGKILGKDTPFPADMGLLLDTPLFLPRFSGYENLMLLMGISKRPKVEKERLVREALEKVGMTEQQNKKVSKYSLGMRQRLGLAQALMEQPTLLILDEPFNGLDRDGVKHIRGLLQTLRDNGVTILLTSHYPEDIAELCETLTCLDGGKIIRQENV